MKISCTLFLTLSLVAGSVMLMDARVRAADLQILTGKQWSGSLSYLDYSKNKRVSIASTLIVKQPNKNEAVWVFSYHYPDEPNANSEKTVTISQDGRTINDETVLERTWAAEEKLRIVTERDGLDNDKNAKFRVVYLIGSNSFSIKKEVRYEGADAYFERNHFEWSR